MTTHFSQLLYIIMSPNWQLESWLSLGEELDLVSEICQWRREKEGRAEKKQQEKNIEV